jgi:hypothetical protein
MAKKIIRLTESDLHRLIKESVKIVLKEEYDNEKVDGYVHYYDAKGRQYRLNYLAQELRNMGIDVEGTGFNDDYDGYVEVRVNLEQAKILDKKYGSKFNMIGKGNSVEEEFMDALRIENMVKGWGH